LYDPLLGLNHQPRPPFSVSTLRARARAAYCEVLWPGYHVLRHEWRQQKEAAIVLEVGSLNALGKGESGSGPIRSGDDEERPGVLETVAGDGRDIAQHATKGQKPRKRVWYVGGEDSRDHDAAIARMDRQAFTDSLRRDDAKLVMLAMLGFSAKEQGAPFHISAGAARARLCRIRADNRKGFEKSCNNGLILGRYLVRPPVELLLFRRSPQAHKWPQSLMATPVTCVCGAASWVRDGACWDCRLTPISQLPKAA
jgi:hypothetical protein